MSLVVGPASGGTEPLRFDVPASKSYVLRALALAALRGRGSVRRRGSDGTDVAAFLQGLTVLGAEIEATPEMLTVRRGVRRTPADPVVVRVEDGGAPARFLAAIAATGKRAVTLEAGPRLRLRPFGPLFAALRELGVEIESRGDTPPAVIRGPARGGAFEAALGEVSSQFVSALLLIAPALGEPFELGLTGVLRSPGYVDMTVAMLRAAGVRVRSAPGWWLVEPGFIGGRSDFDAPADWSSAAPLLATAALSGRPAFVTELMADDGQPDAAFLGHASALGMEMSIERGGVLAKGRPTRSAVLDLGASPDLAPTLAVLAAVTPGGAVLRGAPHLKAKESDRIASLTALLNAAGIPAKARPDGLEVPGTWADRPPGSETPWDAPASADHRLIQAAALLGLVRPVRIADAGHVAKSFPEFFSGFPAVLREETP